MFAIIAIGDVVDQTELIRRFIEKAGGEMEVSELRHKYFAQIGVYPRITESPYAIEDLRALIILDYHDGKVSLPRAA